VMEDFIKGGLVYNPTISAAFIRFLTKQTGQNVSSGVGGQLKSMSDALAQVKAAAKEASEAAREATKASKEASTRSVSATNAADKVSNELKSILAKNTTIKK
jgi:ABC-type glycerol-3-phosphate transport system substrate-binding protein